MRLEEVQAVSWCHPAKQDRVLSSCASKLRTGAGARTFGGAKLISVPMSSWAVPAQDIVWVGTNPMAVPRYQMVVAGIDTSHIAHILWHMIVVLDTDVIVAAVVSSTGASRFLLREVGLGHLSAAASVPLMLEYEAVLKRPETLERAGGTHADMDVILDQLAARIQQVPIWYLCRPRLRTCL